MKIAVMSDLHLEFDARAYQNAAQNARTFDKFDFYFNPPKSNADLLVLAGDWAVRNFVIPTVLVAGNHEFFGDELFRVVAANRQKANETKGQLVFLERATRMWRSPAGERVRIIGTTLWTDFRLYHSPLASMRIAHHQLEDFRAISILRGYKLRLLHPSDTVRFHTASIEFLDNELGRPFDGITIVVTHHAPSPRSIAGKGEGDPLNPASISNIEFLIRKHEPALWIHGHVHGSFDYMIGRTRVVCNPRGHFPDQLNPQFDPLCVAEVGDGVRRNVFINR